MRQRRNRLTALLLALCIALGLAACGSGGKKNGDANQLSGTVYVPEFIDLDLEPDADGVYINGGCCDGKNLYIVADISKDTDRGWENRSTIFRVPLDGSGDAVELENYTPSYEYENDDNGYVDINGVSTGPDGTIWVSERASSYSLNLPEGMNEEDLSEEERWKYMESKDVQVQRQLDSTGTELQRMDISDMKDKIGANYIQNTAIDGDGNIIAYYNGSGHGETRSEGIAAMDKDGNIICNLEGNVWELVKLNNGSVATRYYDQETESMNLRAVDPAAKDWGTAYPMPMSVNKLYDGAGDYLFYYDSGDSLYGYKESTGEGERLLSWSGADINVDDLDYFSFLDDGRVVAMTRSYTPGEGSKTELAILSPTDASALADKTILTFAGMYISQNIRASIIEFNKKSDKYRIEIRDYSEYNTDGDYRAGLTKLNAEIIGGNIPDIISMDELPISRYAAKGFLEDLWPMIDADPEISRDSLMERVFQAAEINGKLYDVFDSFSIATAIGSYKRLGDKMGWTLAELQAALAEMPEGCDIFGETDTQADMLRILLVMNLDGYVNWEKGESYFDSGQFKAALEFSKNFQEEFDYQNYNWEEREDDVSRIANGRQMLQMLSLSDFDDLQIYEAMFGGSEALKTVNVEYNYSEGGSGTYTVVAGSASSSATGEPASQRLIPGRYLSYVGFPREDGGVGSCFATNGGLAISSTCKDKEGAWSFVRQLLLPTYTDGEDLYGGYRYGFPSNKSDFEKMAEKAMEKEYLTNSDGTPVLDQDGEPVEESNSSWGWGGLNINVLATTQEEYDQIMELYNAVDSMYSYDESLFEIIVEQAGPYFAGDKDIDEAVKQIQDRVNLYINENK